MIRGAGMRVRVGGNDCRRLNERVGKSEKNGRVGVGEGMREGGKKMNVNVERMIASGNERGMNGNVRGNELKWEYEREENMNGNVRGNDWERE